MATRQVSTCPLCASPGAHLLDAADRNRGVTRERFDYHRCGSCRTVYLPQPPEDLERYYPADYYFHDDGLSPWRADPSMPAVEAFRVKLVADAVTPGRLIELGAGSGTFAEVAMAAGFEVTAFEMDDASCRFMRGRGVEAIRTARPLDELELLAPARAICAWHVLEHLPDLGDAIRRISDRLEPGGILALGMPNPASLQFRLLRARWAHLDAPRHLCMPPPGALVAHGRRHGLEPVLVTTRDPFGYGCDLHGWTYAVRRRPAAGPPARSARRAGLWLTRAARPIERLDTNGTALLMLMRRTANYHPAP